MIFSEKVSQDFAYRVLLISQELKINPDHLMAVMYFESCGTFSPNIACGGKKWNQLTAEQKQHTAVGLIQFMPKTARNLKTTSEHLAGLPAELQLDWVLAYFKSVRKDIVGKLGTIEDLYMAVLCPAAIGKPNDYVIYADPSIQYRSNKALDWNKSGGITKREATKRVREIYESHVK